MSKVNMDRVNFVNAVRTSKRKLHVDCEESSHYGLEHLAPNSMAAKEMAPRPMARLEEHFRLSDPRILHRLDGLWNKCAIMGAGADLKDQKIADKVDAHDHVFHLNRHHLVKDYGPDVANKVTGVVSNRGTWKFFH